MNLSEILELDYTKTNALEKAAEYYHKNYDYSEGHKFYNGHLEYCLKLKEKQDKGLIVSDEEYINIPCGGGVCGDVWLGYFLVNFHYCLYKPERIDNVEEFDKKLDRFMSEFNLYEHPKSVELNINSPVKYYKEHALKAEEVLNILNITRQTLTSYVKRGLIKLDPNPEGKQYRYNAKSVYALLDGKKKH